MVLSWATLHFVGWVEPTPGFVGFLRLRRTNLHFSGGIAKCETQHLPISKLSPRSFFSDQTGRSRPKATLIRNYKMKVLDPDLKIFTTLG